MSILACSLLIKLYSKNTSSSCLNLSVSYLTECEFVATFCASDRSAPCCFVERKLGWRFLKKIDISGSIEPNKSLKMGKFPLAQASVKWKFVPDALISLDYFCHHQGFVFTRADNNLFVTQLIMREINSSRHHVFAPKTNLEDLCFRMHILIVSNSNLKLKVFSLFRCLLRTLIIEISSSEEPTNSTSIHRVGNGGNLVILFHSFPKHTTKRCRSPS